MKHLWFVVLVIFFVKPLQAQVCTGAPSFREAPRQIRVSDVFGVSVSDAFSADAQAFGASAAAGGRTAFGGGGFAVTSFDGLDSTATSVSGTVGADLPVDRDERVFVCPLGSAVYAFGPDVGSININSFGVLGGARVGVLAAESSNLRVIPTFGVALFYRRVTLDAPGFQSLEESDTSGLATIGVGFVFNGRIGLIPAIVIPFAIPDRDVALSLSFVFNFWG